jgi:heme oxygenase (biliverdin-producing, ferredoxin)
MNSMPSTPVPLAARLRSATHALHTQVERSGLMASLLRGRLSRAGYVLMLRNLQALYAAMETGLQRHDGDPALKVLNCGPLFRADAMSRDLLVLHGPGWAAELPLAPAAQAYVDRLNVLSATWPAGLAAHAYVRYLGDLSGGQALKRIVSTHYAPGAGDGTAFYDFGPPAEVARQATALRTALDGIAHDEDSADRLVAEACEAFAAHGQLFEQLAVLGETGDALV